MHSHTSSPKLRTAYRKAKSLLETIEAMVEADQYCVDIMQQNLAVMGLLRSAHRMLMEQHLHHCFRGAMESGSEKKKRAMIEEMLKVSSFNDK